MKVAERSNADVYTSNARLRKRDDWINLVSEVPTLPKNEVGKALKKMKRGKAGGDDGRTVHLLKDGGAIVLRKSEKLFSERLRTLKLPLAGKKSNVVIIHKNDDVKLLKNYRPISLLSVLCRLFTKVIVNRISDTLGFSQPREEAVFRKCYSTIRPTHAINHVSETSAEYNKPLYIAFIDYEKAFDSVVTGAVMEALRDQGVEETYIGLLEDI